MVEVFLNKFFKQRLIQQKCVVKNEILLYHEDRKLLFRLEVGERREPQAENQR